ncbi:response regulator transcription factor [Clostridioides difficile]|uniref:Response regulator n=1 Tax=Clostridioides difficile TaxID=1496 RepID=A0A386JBW7_CLODI|nr:response regulator transcription factor [Clostridioides difficile]AYD68679.1 response regulator [Clostridioides difficile]HBG7285456.1 response regulator transcription factor [Clostridioides difficile]
MDILLFDNDVNFGRKLKDCINNILIKEGFDNDIVKLYHNVDLLLKDIDAKNKVRIFFIGVDFEYNLNKYMCDGLWLAQEIRRNDYLSPIIFISNYVEISMSIFYYRLEAMDFISKYDMDIAEGRIRACIKTSHERYLKEINYPENFFVIYRKFELWRIPFSDIIYFETCTAPHKIKLVTEEQEIELYRSLKSIVDLDECLFRIHKSFIVNREHIISLNVKGKFVKMSNGDKCPISDRSLQSVKKQLRMKEVSV